MLDVFPRSSMNNLPDGSGINPILFSDCTLNLAILDAYSNYFYFFFCKLCKTVSRAMRWPVSILKFHISIIIFIRAKKEMIGANASSIVAVMTYAKTFCNFPNGELIAKAMSIGRLMSRHRKYPVSTIINCGSPFPTLFRFINLFPKSFRNGATFSHEAGIAYV